MGHLRMGAQMTSLLQEWENLASMPRYVSTKLSQLSACFGSAAADAVFAPELLTLVAGSLALVTFKRLHDIDNRCSKLRWTDI
jgi:hypothetical protein